ncbi:hypothetical protein L9F63_003104, partial [Diploptera punctata]
FVYSGVYNTFYEYFTYANVQENAALQIYNRMERFFMKITHIIQYTRYLDPHFIFIR